MRARVAEGGTDAPVTIWKDSGVLSGRGGGESSLSSQSEADKSAITNQSSASDTQAHIHSHLHIHTRAHIHTALHLQPQETKQSPST